MFNVDPVELLIRVPVILMALTVHEFCHAYFAYRMGDPTAFRAGRCSLNPLRHLEPLGTLCLLFAPIGWAKPVPINPDNFHDRRKGTLVCTAAGPLSNLAQAILWALILRGLLYAIHLVPDDAGLHRFMSVACTMAVWAVFINMGLAVFNCLPLYPLDGFHILLQLIKPGKQRDFAETARFGPFVIMGLVLLGNRVDILGQMIGPPIDFVMTYVAGLGG